MHSLHPTSFISRFLSFFLLCIPFVLSLPLHIRDASSLATALSNATWIWSSPNAATSAPTGETLIFRKTFKVDDPTKSIVSVSILITADNSFTLYVDGDLIGYSIQENADASEWHNAHPFVVPLLGDSVVFAIQATNLGGSAGLLAAAQILYSDGTSVTILTDSSWLVSTDTSRGFEAPLLDDSQWAHASTLGSYGISPWFALVSAMPSTSTAATATFPISSVAISSSPTTTPTPPSRSKLPTGAIIGIALGGVILFVIVSLSVCFYQRHKAQKREQRDMVQSGNGITPHHPTLPGLPGSIPQDYNAAQWPNVNGSQSSAPLTLYPYAPSSAGPSVDRNGSQYASSQYPPSSIGANGMEPYPVIRPQPSSFSPDSPQGYPQSVTSSSSSPQAPSKARMFPGQITQPRYEQDAPPIYSESR